MFDLDSLLALEVPDLVVSIASYVPGSQVLQSLTPEGFHHVQVVGPDGVTLATSLGLDPRLTLLDALRTMVPLPAPTPNWNPQSRPDPRKYLSSVSVHSNVPDPDDVDPEFLKKAFRI